MDQPFLDLPNVIASPHNSAQGDGAHDISVCRAVENCRRALTGEAPLHVIGLDERRFCLGPLAARTVNCMRERNYRRA